MTSAQEVRHRRVCGILQVESDAVQCFGVFGTVCNMKACWNCLDCCSYWIDVVIRCNMVQSIK